MSGAHDAPGRGAWKGALVWALLAIAWVLVWAPRHRLSELHVVTLNDQVGYVTSARWLSETGELRSHVVCPAFVHEPRWRLYMPGHYALLALTFRLLGYGPRQARLPGLAAFVVSVACTFLIGRKLYGQRAGHAAALLVLCFPPDASFAFTAMSEAPFGAAALVALAAFVHLPERLRGPCVPFLLALPFLFRETGALLVVPMAWMVWLAARQGGRRGAAAFLAASVGSLALLGALYAWQTATGKQSPPLSWISSGKPNYSDALLEESLPELSALEWVHAFWRNFSENTRLLLEGLGRESWRSWEGAGMALILAAALASLAAGWRRRRSDPYPLAVGTLTACTLFLLLLFHKAYEHVAIRHVLFTFPLSAVWLGAPAASAAARAGKAGTAAAVLLLVGAGALGVHGMADRFVVAEPPETTRALEELGHDDATVLVAQPQIGMDYALAHYPVRLSFVPANGATLRLLAERFELGTLVVRLADADPRRGLPQELERLGFSVQRLLRIDPDGRVLEVIDRPRPEELRPGDHLVYRR